MRPFFIYLLIYAVLVGAHVIAISYPEGAWSDDWIGYYASSARWLSATGPMELGRRVMVDAFDPSAGNPYDREVARAVFDTGDPYMGWARVHSFLVQVFSLSPDIGFLILHALGCGLYLLSLTVFVQTCLQELPPQEGTDAKWLTPLVILLQTTYLGNPLLIGPAIFNPAMFLLPLALLFFGLLPRPSSWLRLIILCAMILVHSSGILVSIACLCTSFLYRTIGTGSQAGNRERFTGFFQEIIVVGIFFFIIVTAGKLQWIPSLYPLSVSDFRFGWDTYGAHRVWRFIGIGLAVVMLWAFPFTFFQWCRSRRRFFPLPLLIVIWITIMLCSFALLLLVQTWTRQQPALVRFMYTGWPVLLACALVSLVWLVSRPGQTRLVQIFSAVAIVLLVAINIRAGVRFYRPLSAWRSVNNCRFLLEPTREEIQRLSALPGGLVVVFSTRAGGLISFMAGAGDYPVYYSRLTPDWKERVHTDSRRFVLVVAPLMEYLNGTVTDPNEALQLDKDKWLIAWDLAVSRKGTLPIGGNGAAASLGQVARSLDQPGRGCDGRAGSVYRLTTYEQAALAKP